MTNKIMKVKKRDYLIEEKNDYMIDLVLVS